MQYHYLCFFYSRARLQLMMGRQPRTDPSTLYLAANCTSLAGRILLLLRSRQIITLEKFAKYYGVSYTSTNDKYWRLTLQASGKSGKGSYCVDTIASPGSEHSFMTARREFQPKLHILFHWLSAIRCCR